MDRELWNQKARDWHIQVGNQGDMNRQLNSDPYIWKYLGDVKGKKVLDAGCGTGYLSRMLSIKEAQVIAIDYAETMIEIANSIDQTNSVDYQIDSCSELKTIKNDSIDKIVSNYVLMDLPDLPGAAQSFYRVLVPGGTAVITITHPCFPLSDYTKIRSDGSVQYKWYFSYFDEKTMEDPPWKHFTSRFIWYHRPLAKYFREFKRAGFIISDFDEPMVQDPPPLPVKNLDDHRMRPNSVIFLLEKPL